MNIVLALYCEVKHCATILFVCFVDVTHLVYLAVALDYDMPADREGNDDTHSKLR
jgi:hypothetical protein